MRLGATRQASAGRGLLWIVAGLLLLAGCRRSEQEQGVYRPRGFVSNAEERERVARQGTHQDAVRLFRIGDVRTASRILDRLSAAHADSAGDEARLTGATILMSQRRFSAAVPLAQRVIDNGTVAPDFARALLVEAVVEGAISERLAAATSMADTQLRRRGELQSPLLAERFASLLVKGAAVADDPRRVAAAGERYLREWPRSRRSQEVRWLTAQALERIGRIEAAVRAYAEIWFDTPESPWAKQAHDRLRARHAAARRMSVADRLAFAERLQRAGLHEEVLAELSSGGLGGTLPERSRLQLLRTQSLVATGENRDCVQAAEQLRDLAPRSPEAAAAGLVAIRALRRTNDLPALRAWVDWLAATSPGSPDAGEARYQLATFLQGAGRQDEAIQMLLAVAAEPSADRADNALWKLAWAYRDRGDDPRARAAFQRLLDDFPQSAFRKAALYWRARLAEVEDKDTAVRLYREVLRKYPQDYYGHEATRALLALQQRVDWSDYGDPERAFPPIDRLDDPTRQPMEGYARAVSLANVGLFTYAADELDAIPGVEQNPSLAFALADLRSLSGDTWSALEMLKSNFADYLEAGSRDTRVVPEEFWYVAYPFNYRTFIEEAVGESGLTPTIEPALVAALIRMESRFLPSAVSPMGAIGLMQLRLETANELARKLTGSGITRAELFEPETNIRYGTRYLADRVADFRGEWFPAICSYNAGPQPVRKWWSERRLDMPIDEFIEHIPYEDTRLYVKQVIGDFRNYEWIYYQGQVGGR